MNTVGFCFIHIDLQTGPSKRRLWSDHALSYSFHHWFSPYRNARGVITSAYVGESAQRERFETDTQSCIVGIKSHVTVTHGITQVKKHFGVDCTRQT